MSRTDKTQNADTQSTLDDTRETLKRLYISLKNEQRLRADLESRQSEPIAIIGMGCRFPAGANDPAAFWDLLKTGKDGISQVPPDRWDAQSLLDKKSGETSDGKMVTADGGFLNVPLTRFDHPFFKLSPRESKALDPQHRLLLEVTWEALENAGIVPATLKGGRTGVFVGLSGDDYSLAHRHSGDLSAIDAYSLTGSTASTAAGRIAYFLGIEGPAFAVDTACSSALVAIHLACQSLRNGETDLNVVGGVNLILAPGIHVCFSRLNAISPDGRCRTFDARANGYSRAEGCGMVVLKRLGDAKRDGDRILATIRASAVNQDGASNGFTAPNGAAQKRLIRETLDKAGLSPADIQYVETHGTGTPLGDPIEVSAIVETLGKDRASSDPVIIGAVKSNIGHLEAAAGMAGLIKVIMALRHRTIPANLHFDIPNPHIPWDEVPVTVAKQAQSWPEASGPTATRHAALSAFGFSGTNAHLIIGEAPMTETKAPHSTAPGEPVFLALSARSTDALICQAERMEKFLRDTRPETGLYDICATALSHRTAFSERLAIIGNSISELADILAIWRSAASPKAGKVLGDLAHISDEVHKTAEDWTSRKSVDATRIYPNGSYQLIDLPTYAFEPLPCYLGETEYPIIPKRKKTSVAPALRHQTDQPHPLLQRRFHSLLLDQMVWESELGLDTLPLLADHKVLGHPVMAAAGYLSMVIGTAPDIIGDQAFALEAIRFIAPLVLPDNGTVTVQLLIGKADETGKRPVEIASISKMQANLHFVATLVPDVSEEPTSILSPAPNDLKALSPENVYAQQGRNLELGTNFRLATGFARNEHFARAEFGAHLPAPWQSALHPGLVDAGLQLLPLLMTVNDAAAFVPVSIERLYVASGSPNIKQSVAALDQNGNGQVEFLGARGNIILHLSGVEGRNIGHTALADAITMASSTSLTAYALAWLPVNEAPSLLDGANTNWTFIPSSKNLDARTVDSENIVWLSGRNPNETCLAELVSLIQTQITKNGTSRLWIATVNAQKVRESDHVDPVTSSLWGIGRTLAKELPNRFGGLIDLEAEIDESKLTVLLRGINAKATGTEFALRDGILYQARLTTARQETGQTVVREDATYLVTGGTGALGRQLVAWLVDAGAQYIDIVSRTAPSDDARKVFSAIDADIAFHEADIADLNAMTGVFTYIKNTRPPLAGVFHLAGGTAAGMLSDIKPGDIAALTAAKIGGAKVLDQLTRTIGLDHFVLFSSAAGVLGAGGQALYAAANAFLDGLAAKRKDDGLPALSLAWGPWDGDGMASSAAARTQIAQASLGLIAPKAALAFLARTLGTQQSGLLVLNGKFAPAGATGTTKANVTSVAKLPADQRGHALMNILLAEAASALGFAAPADIPKDRDLFELGLDSLMALRIRNAAEVALETALPTTLLFEHPTISKLHDVLMTPGLSPSVTAPQETDTSTSTIADPERLSAGQKGLWLLHRVAPESVAFHTCFTARSHSKLDVHALSEAFKNAIRRHALLGNVITWDGTEPVNQYRGPDAFDLKVIPASNMDTPTLKAEVISAYKVPFRLDRELPLRVTVWQHGPDDWTLLIVIHHISMDVWSFELLLQEAGTDYAQLVAGASPQVSPPKVTFADHVAYTEKHLSGNDGDALRDFWRDTLNGAPEAEAPPFADGHTRNTRFEGQTHHFALDARLAQKIEAFGKSKGATLFATLMSSWAALVHRLTGRNDIVLGTPALGRSQGNLDNTLGFFVNVLPLRVNLAEAANWDSLIDQTRRNLVAAMAHQNLPFRDIAALVPDATTGNELSPLFQTLFHLRVIEDPALAGFFVPGRKGHMTLGPINLEPFYIDQQEGQYPLVVEWFKLGNDLHCALKYNTACLDEERISHLAECYQAFLGQLVDHARDPIASLSPFPAGTPDTNEKDNLLPARECIHQRILSMMAEGPNETAIIANDKTLSRKQLDMRANALAKSLIDAGVAKGGHVGIFMDRSADMVIAALASLKAGTVFIPLSPDLPDGRLDFIIRDADITHVMTTPENRKMIEQHKCATLCLDPENIEETETGPLIKTTPDDPAYILYTSGTTGRPKGVILPHRAMSSYVDAMQIYVPLDQKQDAVLFQTPVSFDPAIAQIFVPLITGTKLVITGPDDHHDPAAIARYVKDHNVTLIYSVPSQIAAWLDHPDFANGSSLKYLFTGGEVLPASLIKRTHERLPNAQLFNVYGPTEATVNVTCWPTPATSTPNDDVRIGYPLANTDITIRDDQGRVVPPGMTGEITIGGDCLALGYLNRPEEDDKSFIENPDKSGAKLYRTGDLGRFIRDLSGKLVLSFVGRKDRQVKIRGNRIELDEVEAVLCDYAEVKSAIARVLTTPSGEKMVAAALVADDAAKQIDISALRAHASTFLASAAVPRQFLCLSSLPLTSHGKLDGKALDEKLSALITDQHDSSTSRSSGVKAGETFDARLRDIWRELLCIREIPTDQHFFDLGGSSLMLTQLQRKIEEYRLGKVEIVDLFRNPTIKSQASLLRTTTARTEPARAKASPSMPAAARSTASIQDIAIIGMNLRTPGAENLFQFWEMVLAGKSGIIRFDKDDLRSAGVPNALIDNANYVPVNGVLGNIELFDARFFGYSPREAELLDPQHRLFLESAWHTLEHAGYGRRSPKDRVGVFAGSEISNYLLFNLAGLIDPSQMNGGYELSLANDKDFLATRVSYALDLRGPAMTVQTACSTSLTAVVQACEALRNGQCEMALAGGVSIQLPQLQGYLYQEGMVASKDGACHPFDANASGTVNGNGVGAVLLKPLDRAMADGDTIHGVLRGWGINNDGHHKLGYTAPSEVAQAAAISQAWQNAGIAPDNIGYIETHGTGTPLGDPIEIAALARAWRENGGTIPDAGDAKCALGAVKANIGHLGAAAGVTGLIKATLSVREAEIPPLAGFSLANPKIPFADLPFAVPETSMKWPDKSGPRTAAVSSFGIGGTNVHIVVAEPPAIKPSPASDQKSLPLNTIFPVSAGSRQGLETALSELGDWVESHGDASLADLAYTLQCGRDGHRWRSVIKASDQAELQTGLANAITKNALNQCHAKPDIVALFPGQGAQYPDMMLDLYQTVSTFRADIDRGLSNLAKYSVSSLVHWKSMLFPSLEGPVETKVTGEASAFLARTENTQPALFIIEYAVARLYERMGVIPGAMLGHSVGEYVAATLAGVFSFEDGVKLIAARGRLMQGLPEGDMLAVATSIEKIEPYVTPDVDIAGDNGPRQCVLSGPANAIAAIKTKLEAENLSCQILPTSHAFHSSMMDPILDTYRDILSTITLKGPQRPMISCLTGDWLSDAQATDPNYWVAQLRGAVCFGKGLTTIMEKAPGLVLEMGPGGALSSRARQIPAATAAKILASDPAPRTGPDKTLPESSNFPSVVADIWRAGISVNWEPIASSTARRRLEIPLYPFDRQRYWIEGNAASKQTRPHKPQQASSGPNYFAPQWRSVPLGAGHAKSGSQDDLVVIAKGAVADQLGAKGLATRTVADDSNAEDITNALRASEAKRKTLVLTTPSFERVLQTARTLDELGDEVTLVILSHHAVNADDGEIAPDAAMLSPLVLGLPREVPNIRCRLIDFDNPALLPLHRELDNDEPIVVWRKGRRRVQKFEPITLDPNSQSVLRTGGVIVITGGLGGIGLTLARHVMSNHGSSVFLIGRTAANEINPDQKTMLAELGARAAYFAADVTDLAAMRTAINACTTRFGKPTAVIHAAGAVKQGPILGKSNENIAALIAPKRDGALVLDQLFRDHDLDGMYFFSSSSAVLGNSGILDYAAANAFLDGLAHKRTAQGYPTISIGWDGWKNIGMSAQPQQGRDERLHDTALDADDGIGAFERISGCLGLPHILVACGDLAAMRNRIDQQLCAHLDHPNENTSSARRATPHQRPDLAVDYIAPSTPQEVATLKIWEEILGVNGIGVADNFFDLGGDSLIGSRLIARMKAELTADLTPVQLYETSTIQAMAATLSAGSRTGNQTQSPRQDDDLDIEVRSSRRRRRARRSETPQP